MKNTILKVLIILTLAVGTVFAQTTEFTYQGRLQNASAPANGNYDFEFLLFDAVSGGTQIGATLTRSSIAVADGTFSVKLDFGGQFSGANRFLEIHVRQTGGGGFTILTPRQAVTSTPYSVTSLSSSSADSLSTMCVLCITDSQIASVDSGKITGILSPLRGGTGIGGSTFPVANTFLRSNGAGWAVSGILPTDVPGGSSNYIQNGTLTQATSNFNISGTGTANIFNAGVQFNLNGNRILGGDTGLGNLFAGFHAGLSNTTGSANAFFGFLAGQDGTTGSNNSYFGNGAGTANTTSSFNSFFGSSAGFRNNGGENNNFFGYQAGFNTTSGSGNNFFGVTAGAANTTGFSNSFFGHQAGLINTTGGNNSFFGNGAGGNTTTGSNNNFFGTAAGSVNTTGSNNTFLGIFAGNVNISTQVNNSTALGAGAKVSTSNTIVLGTSAETVQIPGSLNVTGGTTYGGTFGANIFNATTGYSIGGSQILSSPGVDNIFVGRLAGISTTSGVVNSFFGYRAGEGNVGGSSNSFFGERSGLNSQGVNNSFFGAVSGQSNINGQNNTLLGTLTDVGSPNLNFATALGAGAVVSSSNTVVLGRNIDTVQIPGALNVTGTTSFTGTLGANIFNGTTQFNIGGNRVLSVPGTENLFVGVGAGSANTTGFDNSYFGKNAGFANLTGTNNSFFGAFAGQYNTNGANAFFGAFAGNNNTGGGNSFIGAGAGQENGNGNFNSFVGYGAGLLGSTQVLSEYNSFFGAQTGLINLIGRYNTIVGAKANLGADNLEYATAIGANAIVSQSYSLVLGSSGLGSSGIFDTRVGIGTTAPSYKLEIVDSQNKGLRVQNNTAGGTVASFGGNGAFWVDSPGVNAGRFIITEAGKVGINTNNPLNALDVAGAIALRDLGFAGTTALCRNVSLQISTCSSSIRYKQNINPFTPGLSLIKQLRPVSFNWKANNQADFGLVAEEVNKVEPLLTTTNEKGEIEGVKYDRVGVVLVNAVQEQQAQIEAQQKEILGQKQANEAQQKQLDEQNQFIKLQNEKLEAAEKQLQTQKSEFGALKALVCAQNPTAELCKQ